MTGQTDSNGSDQQQQQQQAPAPWFADDQRDFVATKGWKAPADAVASAINLEKLLGADKAGRAIVRPKDDTDADGLKAYRSGIGVPDSPDGYGTPDSLKDDPVYKAALTHAHKHGLPKKEFLGFVEDFMGAQRAALKEQADQQGAELAAQVATLRKDWGDKYDANVELAKRAMKAFAAGAKLDEDTIAGLDDAVTKSPGVQRLFAFIAQGLGEDKFSAGDGSQSSGSGKLRIQQQLDELRTQRVEGKITQQDFDTRSAALGAQLDAAA